MLQLNMCPIDHSVHCFHSAHYASLFVFVSVYCVVFITFALHFTVHYIHCVSLFTSMCVSFNTMFLLVSVTDYISSHS